MTHPSLVCPTHQLELSRDPSGELTVCPAGCSFPVTGGIARIVRHGHYAERFGMQWKRFRKTQLDSHTGTTISRDRLTRLMGGSLDWLAGKTVLEAGCGAGRFTEILLSAGALVTAVDLSAAVEANRDNFAPNPNLRLVQTDLRSLPFPPESFDVVACVGVVQHTPDPEQTLAALARQVKPGGVLVFDHYTHGYAMTPSRTMLRRLILALPADWSLPVCKALHGALWPLHKMLWRFRANPAISRLRRRFLELSPLVDYHDHYAQIGPELLSQWVFLDTHDTLSDRYKHLRGREELETALTSLGLTDIRVRPGGNGMEAMARKPDPPGIANAAAPGPAGCGSPVLQQESS